MQELAREPVLFLDTARTLWTVQIAVTVAFAVAFWGLATRLAHPLMYTLALFWGLRLASSISAASYWWFGLYGSVTTYFISAALGLFGGASVPAARQVVHSARLSILPSSWERWRAASLTGLLIMLALHAANVRWMHESQLFTVMTSRVTYFLGYGVLAVASWQAIRKDTRARHRLLPLLVGSGGFLLLGIPDTWIRLRAISTPSSDADVILAVGTTIASTMLFGVSTLLSALEAERDIIKQNAERLRQARVQAVESGRLQGLGQLAGGVAHDFNSVLSVIQGSAELAAYELHRDPAATRAELAALKRAAERGAALTRRLLLFARRKPGHVQRFAPAETLAELAPVLSRVLHQGVTLATAAESTACVRADPTQFEQIVLNLVVNARDAMPGGGGIQLTLDDVTTQEPQTLTRGQLPAGVWMRLVVQDEGTGIAPEHLSAIFEPFFSTKGSAGTGLGLATIAAILDELGGAISVDSVQGAGTRVAVFLPTCSATGESPVRPTPPHAVRQS
jgi:signal transduction histidine kinase